MFSCVTRHNSVPLLVSLGQRDYDPWYRRPIGERPAKPLGLNTSAIEAKIDTIKPPRRNLRIYSIHHSGELISAVRTETECYTRERAPHTRCRSNADSRVSSHRRLFTRLFTHGPPFKKSPRSCRSPAITRFDSDDAEQLVVNRDARLASKAGSRVLKIE
jgi:hypothetical protein